MLYDMCYMMKHIIIIIIISIIIRIYINIDDGHYLPYCINNNTKSVNNII